MAVPVAIWKFIGLLLTLSPLLLSADAGGATFFRDVSAHALGRNQSFDQQLSHGIDYWAQRLDAASQIDLYGLNGIAAGDYDGDGWEDFYVCQPGGLPNRLFRNLGNGTFQDVTIEAGLAVLDSTSAALWADYDNDGDQDLFVITVGDILLFEHDGRGRFVRSGRARFEVPLDERGTMMMGAAADYDRDGFVDLYVCQYSPATGSVMANPLHHPTPYYDANNGPPNQMFRNNGDGTFSNVTKKTGLSAKNSRWSFAAAWGDYNQDGYPDLYVANDFGRNNLYRNNRNGTFSDVAAQAGAEDIGPGMSACWGDYDNDGRLDLYISNIWNAAGQKLMRQADFQPAAPEPIRGLFRRFAKGNTLLRNIGDGSFEETSAAAGVENAGWAWGSAFFDFDSDGWEDLFVVNGHLTNDNKTDLESFHWEQLVAASPLEPVRSKRYDEAWRTFHRLISESGYSVHGGERKRFYRNTGDGRFIDASRASGLDFTDDGRAFAFFDFDNDGDLDLAIKNRTAPQVRVLRNDAPRRGHALVLELKGRSANRDAVGARVSLKVAGRTRIKELHSGAGFLSQHTRRIYIGLGDQDVISDVRIDWPGGEAQKLYDVPVDRIVRVEQGKGELVVRPFSTRRPAGEPVNIPPAPAKQDRDDPGIWLLERLPLPNLKLFDLAGNPRSLVSEQRGAPVLIALHPDARVSISTPEQLASGSYTAPLETVALLKSIVKHLFVRRREVELPLGLLLDQDGYVVKVYPGVIVPDASRDLGRIPRNDQGRLEAALPFPGRYYGAPASRLECYFSVANECLKNGLPDQALEYFGKCLEIDPKLGSVVSNVGTIYSRRGMLDQALAHFERAAQLEPQSAEVRFNIGTTLALQQRYNEAIAALDQAVRFDPAAPEIWLNLGNVYLDAGRSEPARAALERVLALDPRSALAHNSLGTLYGQKGMVEHAIRHFQEAARVQPDYASAHLNLGIVFLRQDDRTKALEHLRRVLELDPANLDARRLIEQVQKR